MRVLFLTHRLPFAPNRGDRIRAYHMLRTLAAHAEVDLVSLVHTQEEMAELAGLRGVAASVLAAPVPRLRNHVSAAIALAGARPLTHALLAAKDLGPRLEHHVATRPPDVILAYCSGMARFAMASPLDRIPFVLDMVDVDSEKWAALATVSQGWRAAVYRREARCLARFEAAAVRRAAATLVVNERERAALEKLAPGAPIHIISNGIDTTAFRPTTPPTERPVVVFCGVMSYEPNSAAARWLVESVWPLVQAARPDARLQLVGADPPRALRRLADKHPTVEFTGTVPEVMSRLWASAVAVAPLHTGRGIQNKVLEAIAAGLPCVVTSVVEAGLPSEVLPACIVADNASAFAASILELLARSPEDRRAIASRADLSSLGWDRRLSGVLPLLADVATRKNANTGKVPGPVPFGRSEQLAHLANKEQ